MTDTIIALGSTVLFRVFVSANRNNDQWVVDQLTLFNLIVDSF